MTRIHRLRRVSGWVLWVASVLTISVYSLERTSRAGARAQDDPRFTGVSTSMEATNLSVGRRHFDPGARSAWHHHDHGQLLFVEEGRARFQKRGEPLQELSPGESVYTAPNVEHWHGAAPGEEFVQVHIGFGSGITWLERVTDAEYEGR